MKYAVNLLYLDHQSGTHVTYDDIYYIIDTDNVASPLCTLIWNAVSLFFLLNDLIKQSIVRESE